MKERRSCHRIAGWPGMDVTWPACMQVLVDVRFSSSHLGYMRDIAPHPGTPTTHTPNLVWQMEYIRVIALILDQGPRLIRQ